MGAGKSGPRTVLPLSIRDDLPHNFGTRHRAAVGLAEQTDALVIVVSEERGKVVVAKGNALIPIGDNLALQELLIDHLGMAERQGGAVQKERF